MRALIKRKVWSQGETWSETAERRSPLTRLRLARFAPCKERFCEKYSTVLQSKLEGIISAFDSASLGCLVRITAGVLQQEVWYTRSLFSPLCLASDLWSVSLRCCVPVCHCCQQNTSTEATSYRTKYCGKDARHAVR